MTHAPTSSGPPRHTPTTCWCCGRRAFGIGVGTFGRGKDPLFLCEACIPLLEQIKAVRSFDHYENQAIDDAIAGVGSQVEANGSDLGEWTESQVRQFVTDIILGFGDSIRRQVREQEVPY